MTDTPTLGLWIPVSERLPELYQDVLICFTTGVEPIVRVAFLDECIDCESEFVWIESHSGNPIDEVSHWAGIAYPQPPTP